jgi:hypothetical protein
MKQKDIAIFSREEKEIKKLIPQLQQRKKSQPTKNNQ